MTTKQAQHTSHPPFWPDEDQLVNLLLRDNPYTLFGGVSPQEALAWARAQSREMLAASDLLAALEAAVEGEAWQSSRDRPGVAPEWLLHAKAAIAAATGGQP